MFLVLFFIFGLQHQIERSFAFGYPQDNKSFLSRRINELQVQNFDYGDVAAGAKNNAKEQGFSLPGKAAPAQSAADAFRNNINFNDESHEAKPPAHHHLLNDPSIGPHAPLRPVISNRLKVRKHKPRERVYQPEQQPSATPLAPTPPAPQAETTLGRLLRSKQPPSLVVELEKRKARLNAEFAIPTMRVDTGPPPAVLAYGTSKEGAREQALAVPDANLLDMAKAVGGHVPSLRYRNRLCSRHVLIPEGPKYDSKGAIYLPAYSPKNPKGTATTRDYANTHAPHQLLPKCCNCCKKSVLGCE